MIYLASIIVGSAITALLYQLIGWDKISECMKLWLRSDYWTDYNRVEFAAWVTKAAVIIPGLVFGVEIWQLHFLTLITSAALIWASMRKLLPTLVAFNSLWIILSTTVILRKFFA